MVTLIPRATWGAQHRDGDGGTMPAGGVDVIAIHHTASVTLPATATEAQERAAMRNLEQTGQNRFRTGIGYHVVVFASGRAYVGVTAGRRGTHTGGRNTTTFGIAFQGNMETATPTAAALETVRQVVAWARGRHTQAAARIAPHREFSATACPGRNVMAIIGSLGNAPATPAPAPTPAPVPVPTAPVSINDLARQVIAGQWGNGADRARRLTAAGHDAGAVQRKVNAILAGGTPAPAPAPTRTIAQMADEVIRGLHGNGHAARQRSLGVTNAVYAQVRAEVNRRFR